MSICSLAAGQKVANAHDFGEWGRQVPELRDEEDTDTEKAEHGGSLVPAVAAVGSAGSPALHAQDDRVNAPPLMHDMGIHADGGTTSSAQWAHSCA